MWPDMQAVLRMFPTSLLSVANYAQHVLVDVQGFTAF
jgi:hypothetical protein